MLTMEPRTSIPAANPSPCGPPASEIPPKIDIWDDSPIHTVASSIEDQLRMEGYRVSPVTYIRAAQVAIAALDAPALRREDEGREGR